MSGAAAPRSGEAAPRSGEAAVTASPRRRRKSAREPKGRGRGSEE